MHTNQDTIEIDLIEILYVLKKRIILIVLAMIILGSLTGIYSKVAIESQYSSTAKLYILTKSTSITSLADIQVGTSLTQDYMELIKSRPVVEEVIENLKLDRTYEQMLDQISITNPTGTRILSITALDTNPELAKAIVDEFADVSRISISKIMRTDEPSIVEYGYSSLQPVSPNVMKNIVIGGLLGMIIAMGIVVVIHLLDDTIKTAEDVEKYLGMNTLASIPMKSEETKINKSKSKQKGRNNS